MPKNTFERALPMSASNLLGLLVAPLAALLCSDTTVAAPSVSSASTIQSIMRTEVDSSADFVWDSVETVVTRKGEQVRQPRTPEQWAAVRRRAVLLVAGSRHLQVAARRVSLKPFAAEAQGALDSAQIQQRIDENWPTFLALAQTLERTASAQLQAVDAREVATLVAVGGRLDAVCEACHLSFWYPNQVIPQLPPERTSR
jgi:hypothetical protein